MPYSSFRIHVLLFQLHVKVGFHFVLELHDINHIGHSCSIRTLIVPIKKQYILFMISFNHISEAQYHYCTKKLISFFYISSNIIIKKLMYSLGRNVKTKQQRKVE